MCRMCMQYFCCRNCKSKHETTQHQIFEDCELCIYGQTYFKSPSEKLLQHVKNKHLPLHCLFCKRVFLTLEDLLYGHGCSGQKNGNKNAVNENYQSPITDMFHKSIISGNKFYTNQNVHYSTSTPMQKNDDGEFRKIPEVITPVEYYNRLQKSHIEPSKCHDTPISSSQANSIKANMKYISKEDTNIESKPTPPKSALICEDSHTVWESALATSNFAESDLVSKDTIPSPSLGNNTSLEFENFSVNELYSTTEYNSKFNISSVTRKYNVIAPKNNLRGKSDSKPQFMLENVEEESSTDENIDPNVYSFRTQTTKTNCKSYNTHTENVWTTVANAWKSAWKSLSHKGSQKKKTQKKSIKRPQSDDSDDAPELKRFKIADVQCRKTIHAVPTLRYFTNTKQCVMYYDKAVQTD